MKTVMRFDRGTLRKPERTPEGFLRVEAFVSRPGIYEYINTPEDEADGFGKAGTIRRELRADEMIRSNLDGYRAATVTVRHPPGLKVTPKNVKAVEVGTVDGPAWFDETANRAAAALVVKDASAIKAVESGMQEVSPGYEAEVEIKSGVDPKYGRYDVVVHSIHINHVAITDRARGGSDLRMRMDEAGRERCDSMPRLTSAVDGHQHLIDTNTSIHGFCSNETSWAVSEGAECGHSHPWIRNADGSITIGESAGHTHSILDERTYAAVRGDEQIDRPHHKTESQRMPNGTDDQDTASKLRLQTVRADEQEQLATQRKVRIDELEAQVSALTAKVTTLEEQRTALEKTIKDGAQAVETEAVRVERARADEAELKLSKLESNREGEVNERAELVVRARAILGTAFRTDSLSNDAICEAGIKALRPKEDLKGKDGAYLRARFHSLCEDRMASDASQSRAALTMRADENRDPVAPTESPASRAKAWREQWKKPYQSPATRKGA